MTTDTKAYWRRRALRAEAEMQNLRNIRSIDNKMEMYLSRENAALRVAIAEIREVLDDLGLAGEMEVTA